MQALINSGFNIFPVNPNEIGNTILGQKCYSSLTSIKESIDMVDIFRNSDAVIDITKEAIEIKAKVIWMQLNIVNLKAKSIAVNAGLKVVMNKCPKQELEKLYWTLD